MTPHTLWDFVSIFYDGAKKIFYDVLFLSKIAAGDQVAKSIAPTVTQVKPEEETALDASGKSENPREGKFCCYAVTKTETSTVFRITATTTVTFKCTPSMSILNMCE